MATATPVIQCAGECTVTIVHELPVLDWWLNMPLADGAAIAVAVSFCWAIGWFGRQLMRS